MARAYYGDIPTSAARVAAARARAADQLGAKFLDLRGMGLSQEELSKVIQGMSLEGLTSVWLDPGNRLPNLPESATHIVSGSTVVDHPKPKK